MHDRRPSNILFMAGLASLATSAAVSILARHETGHTAAGLNATSHILWGDRASKVNDFDAKHTVAGALLNSGAMLSWALVHSLLPRANSVPAILTKGALVSALAYVTDYHVVPKRLTPGFEKRLTTPSLAAVYGVLAASIAAADWFRRFRKR